jgi:hypothetical protein
VRPGRVWGLRPVPGRIARACFSGWRSRRTTAATSDPTYGSRVLCYESIDCEQGNTFDVRLSDENTIEEGFMDRWHTVYRDCVLAAYG